jgi:hypothetical protein
MMRRCMLHGDRAYLALTLDTGGEFRVLSRMLRKCTLRAGPARGADLLYGRPSRM